MAVTGFIALAPGAVFATLLAQLASVLHYSRLKMLVTDKHSSLLDPFVSLAKNEVM
jgi:hypothetical protein